MTIDSNKNFSNYRSLLQRITPPCVPFIGMWHLQRDTAYHSSTIDSCFCWQGGLRNPSELSRTITFDSRLRIQFLYGHASAFSFDADKAHFATLDLQRGSAESSHVDHAP
jgi:hypothetical protein